MIGDGHVGKTSLISQFITSEHMHTFDASLDDEYGEKSVSVRLDGEEVELCFIDHPSNEMSVRRNGENQYLHIKSSNDALCVIIVKLTIKSSHF